jgi:hypothetical protein
MFFDSHKSVSISHQAKIQSSWSLSAPYRYIRSRAIRIPQAILLSLFSHPISKVASVFIIFSVRSGAQSTQVPFCSLQQKAHNDLGRSEVIALTTVTVVGVIVLMTIVFLSITLRRYRMALAATPINATPASTATHVCPFRMY